MSALLTFDAFRSANVARCLKWHPEGLESWSPSDWLTAVTGELGELASLLKMRNRERDGLPGNKFSPSAKQVADEIADVLTYLDLLAAALGVDLGTAAAAKFNEVSARVGFPDRINLDVAGDVFGEIRSERRRQDEQWGGPDHDDEHSPQEWAQFLHKQWLAAAHEAELGGDYRGRLVKIAALAVAAAESYDRTIRDDGTGDE